MLDGESVTILGNLGTGFNHPNRSSAILVANWHENLPDSRQS